MGVEYGGKGTLTSPIKPNQLSSNGVMVDARLPRKNARIRMSLGSRFVIQISHSTNGTDTRIEASGLMAFIGRSFGH